MSPVCVPPHQACIPTLLGQVMGGATWGALLGSVAAAVDHVSEIALFWMCLLDACLYLQIVNTDLNKKKKKRVAGEVEKIAVWMILQCLERAE